MRLNMPCATFLCFGLEPLTHAALLKILVWQRGRLRFLPHIVSYGLQRGLRGDFEQAISSARAGQRQYCRLRPA